MVQQARGDQRQKEVRGLEQHVRGRGDQGEAEVRDRLLEPEPPRGAR